MTLAELDVMTITSARQMRDRAIAEARFYKFDDLRRQAVQHARRLNAQILKSRADLRRLRSIS